jgi:sulfite reductase (NADPH) flavoprotein alpha-component
MQAEQNIPVGPIYYYFGSRHQSQEYLYGEELEAYVTSGIITKAGFAFSRDGPKKVYIQHKMVEHGGILGKALHQEKGAFYLCGPTWPVPDVYEALVDSLVTNNLVPDAKSAGEYLESLKGEERYVLEVCVVFFGFGTTVLTSDTGLLIDNYHTCVEFELYINNSRHKRVIHRQNRLCY